MSHMQLWTCLDKQGSVFGAGHIKERPPLLETDAFTLSDQKSAFCVNVTEHRLFDCSQ